MSKLDELRKLEAGHYTKDGKFITYFADPEFVDVNTILNALPALLKVVEASKALTNLYKAMGPEIENCNPRVFWSLVQKYCDEYGALAIALRELEGE